MKIIISGGGIGGLTLANLLYRQGHQPVIIERAQQFSNAGFVISLKSFGVEIMNELGLEEKMRAEATRSNSVDFRKPNGNLIRELDFETINKDITDNIMAPRATIHRVLYDAVKNNVEILFGTTIASAIQNDDGVCVQFADGSKIEGDLLIIAEGIRSATRARFWTDVNVEDFNIYYAAGRLVGKHSYKTGNYLTYRAVKKMLAILPLNENELAIQCYIHNTGSAENLQNIERGLLSGTFKDFDPGVQELIKRLENKGGIFSDKIGMVHAPVLYKGRVVLLGDAGYCPTSLSGMGASLSIFGARALAQYLHDFPGDLPKALENYNGLLQPVINKFQSNARKNAGKFLPMNKMKLSLMNTLFKFIPLSAITKKMNSELSLTTDQRKFVVKK